MECEYDQEIQSAVVEILTPTLYCTANHPPPGHKIKCNAQYQDNGNNRGKRQFPIPQNSKNEVIPAETHAAH